MTVLKNVALGFMSFFLFLSLLVFGLAFMLYSTVLKPHFLTSEIDRLDIALLVEESLNEETFEQELSEEYKTAIVDNIGKIEPRIKEQVNAATYSIYDYLLGKKQNLELALTLRNTVFSKDLFVSIMDDLDMSYFISEFTVNELAKEIPEDMKYLVEYFDEYLVEYFDEYVDDVIIENKSWMKEQINIAADPVLDYLFGESQSLNVVISLEPLTESLRDTLREPFLELPPAELVNLPPKMLEQVYDDFFEELAETMPTFKIDESLFEPELRADITEALAEAEKVLEKIRQGISYFKLGYILLIVFILLLIAGIILISRDVRYITRSLGITFLVYGALELVGVLVTRHFTRIFIPMSEIQQSLQVWIPQFLGNLLAPLLWFSVGMLIVGIALIAFSIVYKRGQPSTLD